MLKVRNDHGFFSCCSVRLYEIINFYNDHRCFPPILDSTDMFLQYKPTPPEDVTFDFFEHYKNIEKQISHPIPSIDAYMYQFSNYKDIPYASLKPYVKRYFTPASQIKSRQQEIISKYQIEPQNCIAVYYRGTDKQLETQVDSYESFYKRVAYLNRLINNPNVKVLIQTDTKQFQDYMRAKLPNVVVVEELKVSASNAGIHNEQSNQENHADMLNLLPVLLIAAQCKYIICTSGNVSVWTLLFRGNADNVHQNLDRVWL